MTPLAIVALCAAAFFVGSLLMGWMKDAQHAKESALTQELTQDMWHRERALLTEVAAAADQRATNAWSLLERQTGELTGQIVKLTAPKTYDASGKSLSLDEADAEWMKLAAKSESIIIAGDPLMEQYGG